jgi:hypothetical protein
MRLHSAGIYSMNSESDPIAKGENIAKRVPLYPIE